MTVLCQQVSDIYLSISKIDCTATEVNPELRLLVRRLRFSTSAACGAEVTGSTRRRACASVIVAIVIRRCVSVCEVILLVTGGLESKQK